MACIPAYLNKELAPGKCIIHWWSNTHKGYGEQLTYQGYCRYCMGVWHAQSWYNWNIRGTQQHTLNYQQHMLCACTCSPLKIVWCTKGVVYIIISTWSYFNVPHQHVPEA